MIINIAEAKANLSKRVEMA